MSLWLDPIPPAQHGQAEAALQAGDAAGFLWKASNHHGLHLVARNAGILRQKGIYERALLHALISCRVNNAHMDMPTLRCLVSLADRKTLLAAGTALPGPGPFELFRGVAGRGSRRRVRGLSWTVSFERARWFAERSGKYFGLGDPRVYRVVVPADRVLAYTDDRQEREFLVQLAPGDHPKRIE